MAGNWKVKASQICVNSKVAIQKVHCKSHLKVSVKRKVGNITEGWQWNGELPDKRKLTSQTESYMTNGKLAVK